MNRPVTTAGNDMPTFNMTNAAAVRSDIPYTRNISQPAPQPQFTQPYQPRSDIPSSGPLRPAGTTQPGGTLSKPGAYEQWYSQNQARFSQPTTLAQYYSQVSGRLAGQRFQPTNAQGAYDQMRSGLSGDSYGMREAQDIGGQLKNRTQGEGVMGEAANAYRNLRSSDLRNIAVDPRLTGQGELSAYRDEYGDAIANPGYGQNLARNVLEYTPWGEVEFQDPTSAAGQEYGYFRDPLREKSYSEQLYESGNQGLNTYYDLQRKRQQEDLENQMAAMGLFGSGETVEAMSRLREGLGAEQARDMAGLAGQADEARLGRASTLANIASGADSSELGRIDRMLAGQGLRLDASGQMMDYDRLSLDRLMAGAGLASQEDQYGLQQVGMRGDLIGQAEGNELQAAQGLGNVGNAMAGTELNRMGLGLQAANQYDEQQRARLNDIFQGASNLDNLRLQGANSDLAYLTAGGNMAGQVDQGNLSWLTAGGDAADRAQDRFETRERYSFTDPLAMGSAMATPYSQMSGTSANEQAQLKQQAVTLLMQQYGMSAEQAQNTANAWAAAGQSPLKMAMAMGGGG